MIHYLEIIETKQNIYIWLNNSEIYKKDELHSKE